MISCDDLYDTLPDFGQVYDAIVERVISAAQDGPVVYGVPGSPIYGERSVVLLRNRCREEGHRFEMRHAPSFLDEVFSALEFDPTDRGFSVLDGRDLPDPLLLHLPTVVFQIDDRLVLDDVMGRISHTLPDDTPVTLLTDLGTTDRSVKVFPLGEVPLSSAGLRSTLFIDPPARGIVGALKVMRRLRTECPWDRQQTHASLVPYVVEETFELVEAIGNLPDGDPDFVAYHDLEEELGDLLLQVIFHSNLATEVGAFDIEQVADTLMRKLVRRHPHVFGEVVVEDADEVVANWVAIKAAEKSRPSLMDGVPAGMPGLDRAVKLQKRAKRVGFDWPDVGPVVNVVAEELAELSEVLEHPDGPDRDRSIHELGDLLFAVANLARHLDISPELALRESARRFERRFRRMEELGNLETADTNELERVWEQAKEEEEESRPR